MQKVRRPILFTFQLLVVLNLPVAMAQDRPQQNRSSKQKIVWYLPETADSLRKKSNAPLLIDLYTDWCGWCRVMDKKTYGNPSVAAYVNEHFIPVRIDAESRTTIRLFNMPFVYKELNKLNDIAIFLTGGRLSFPTTVIIPEDGKPRAIAGYLPAADMMILLQYFAEGAYKREVFSDFSKKTGK